MLCPEAAHCTQLPSDTHPSPPAARQHPAPTRVPYKVCFVTQSGFSRPSAPASAAAALSQRRFPGGSAPPAEGTPRPVIIAAGLP